MDVMLFCWTRGDVDTSPAKKTEMIRQILHQLDGMKQPSHTPHYPRYNGAQEKGSRDFKAALDQRPPTSGRKPKDSALAVEDIAHVLNHQPRRCFNGRTAGAGSAARFELRMLDGAALILSIQLTTTQYNEYHKELHDSRPRSLARVLRLDWQANGPYQSRHDQTGGCSHSGQAQVI